MSALLYPYKVLNEYTYIKKYDNNEEKHNNLIIKSSVRPYFFRPKIDDFEEEEKLD